MFVEVAVPLGIRKTFAYSVPAPLVSRVAPGMRVLVPFGRKLLTGFVVSTSSEQPDMTFTLRPIRDALDREPAVGPDLVATAQWVAQYYFAPPGEVFRALLPAGIEITGSEQVKLSRKASTLLDGGLRPGGLRPEEEKILDALLHIGPVSAKRLASESGVRSAAEWVESLVLGGWVEVEDALEKPKVSIREQLGIRTIPADPETKANLSPTQTRLLDILEANGKSIPLQEVLKKAGCTAGVAHALVAAKVAEIAPIRIERVPLDLTDAAAL